MSKILLLAALLVAPSAALAQDAPDAPSASTGQPAPAASTTEEAQADASTAFEEDFAFGVYGTGWAGAYLGAGVGGRLRWEPFEMLGLDVFGESLLVENSGGGLRHDHVVGFNLYIPIEITPTFRLRPLFGFCADFSMMEPAEEGAPRADDVLFGVHGGAGIEWAPLRRFSFFVDVQATAYLGHDRSSQGWTGEVSEDYAGFGVVQANLGAQFHFSL